MPNLLQGARVLGSFLSACRDVKFSAPSFRFLDLPKVKECGDERYGHDAEDDEEGYYYEVENVLNVHGQLATACLKYLLQDEVQNLHAKISPDNFGGGKYKCPLLAPRDDLLD